MKNYKDYNKTYIGSSDSAYLTLKTITGTTEKLCFGEDGSYSAYVVDEDTLIPEHYHKEFEFTDSLEIYNNFGELEWSAKAKQISVYTAGNFGCLIKLQGAENYKFDLNCRSDKADSLTFGLGINMMILNIGMPLACTGLLDNDKGMFKNYFMTYVKTFLTVLIQVVLSKLGLYIIVTSAGIGNIVSGNFDLVKMFLGLACLTTALSTPKLLAEFLVPSGPGGSAMSKIYAVNTIKTAIKGFTK